MEWTDREKEIADLAKSVYETINKDITDILPKFNSLMEWEFFLNSLQAYFLLTWHTRES